VSTPAIGVRRNAEAIAQVMVLVTIYRGQSVFVAGPCSFFMAQTLDLWNLLLMQDNIIQ
jgi:hypothetical protein